jgi:hypothetical protein
MRPETDNPQRNRRYCGNVQPFPNVRQGRFKSRTMETVRTSLSYSGRPVVLMAGHISLTAGGGYFRDLDGANRSAGSVLVAGRVKPCPP